MIEVIGLAMTALLAENLVLVYCMGIGTDQKAFLDPGEGRRVGIGLTLMMVVAGVLSRFVDTWLTNFHLSYLSLLAFVLLIPMVSAVLGWLMKFFIPGLSKQLAEPVRTALGNAAVLGAILIASQRGYTVQQTFIFTLFGGIGLTLCLSAFAGLREEISLDSCPKYFRGAPILFITGGLMALAMIGYYGLNIR